MNFSHSFFGVLVLIDVLLSGWKMQDYNFRRDFRYCGQGFSLWEKHLMAWDPLFSRCTGVSNTTKIQHLCLHRHLIWVNESVSSQHWNMVAVVCLLLCNELRAPVTYTNILYSLDNTLLCPFPVSKLGPLYLQPYWFVSTILPSFVLRKDVCCISASGYYDNIPWAGKLINKSDLFLTVLGSETCHISVHIQGF